MNAREKRVVIVGGVLILVGAVWRGGAADAVARWGDARARLAAESARVADLTRRAERRDAVGGRLRQRLGPAATKELPGEAEAQAGFPAAVREALGGAGLSIASVSVQGVQRVRELPGVSLVRVLVEGSADGGSVPAVLAGTRSLPRVTRVEELRLVKADDGWSVRLVLSTPARRGGDDGAGGRGGAAVASAGGRG